MLFRLEYLQNYYHVDLMRYIHEYEEIRKQFDLLIYKIIKGNVAHKRTQYIECLDILGQVKAKEVRILTEFINKEEIKSSRTHKI